MQIAVDNIKCGGCANSIRQALLEIPQVSDVSINVENGVIDIDHNAADRQLIIDKLYQLGYPEQNSTSGMQAATRKAKSFVSCAVGRMSNTEDTTKPD